MTKLILKRLGTLIPVLLVVSLITFFLGSISSGDTARILAEKRFERPTLTEIEEVRVEMGFDRPIPVQYVDWLSKVLTGDLGTSYANEKPVVSEISRLFPKTLQLAACGLLFIVIISFTLGILSAVHAGSWFDKLCRGYCFLTASMPEFWLALLVLFVFGAKLSFIPVLGGSSLKYPIPPALVVAVCTSGIYIRLVKTSMEETLSRGYIRAARANGIREWKVVGIHALKNAALPVLNKLGIGFGAMLAGSSIIESIFSWNGLGKLALKAVKIKDFPVVQGYVLFMALLIVIINLTVDILCGMLDPRLRSERGR